MSTTLALKISAYIGALVAANYVVHLYGPTGLLFTAFLLIPFDFVIRCLLHETWKGLGLVVRMAGLIVAAGTITYLTNPATGSIALASVCAFSTAQVVAGLFYQATIKQRPLIKVNGSDLVGIVADSTVFQWVAFGSWSGMLTLEQSALKFAGGLLWYWIIFNLFGYAKRLRNGQGR
mgnify:FL=1